MQSSDRNRELDVRGRHEVDTHHLVIGAIATCIAIAVPASAAATEVPVEVATGPSFYNLDRPQLGGEPNALAADQPWHFGWRLEIAAVIDREWARENPEYIPEQHRERLQRVERVRYSPAFLSFIPRSLFISPKVHNTGIYGATWELLHAGIGATFGDARLNVGAGLLATYTFIHSETLPSPFHFIRPGVDLGAYLFVPFGNGIGLSVGWDSHMYIPQRIGGGVFEIGGARENLWHIGEASLALHFTVPYQL